MDYFDIKGVDDMERFMREKKKCNHKQEAEAVFSADEKQRIKNQDVAIMPIESVENAGVAYAKIKRWPYTRHGSEDLFDDAVNYIAEKINEDCLRRMEAMSNKELILIVEKMGDEIKRLRKGHSERGTLGNPCNSIQEAMDIISKGGGGQKTVYAPGFRYAPLEQKTVFVEAKQKMVLVPVEKLNAAIMQFQVDGDYMMERELTEWKQDAPVAAIPLAEVPEKCAVCPAIKMYRGSCGGLIMCQATEKHVKPDSRSGDCPIVTKE